MYPLSFRNFDFDVLSRCQLFWKYKILLILDDNRWCSKHSCDPADESIIQSERAIDCCFST